MAGRTSLVHIKISNFNGCQWNQNGFDEGKISYFNIIINYIN